MDRKSFKISSKLICRILLVFGLFFFVPQQAEAQFFKKLAKKAKQKIDREAEKRAERRVNKKIDKEFDKAEDALDGKKKNKKKKKESKESKKSKGINVENERVEGGNEIKKPNVVWSRFDFIPGDTVIFEDGPDLNEDNGEFPSRWDLVNGNSEIINVDNTNVISFPQGGTIIPYIENSKDDYLPVIFTIQFDVYFRPEYSRRIWVSFYDQKNQRNSTDTKRAGFYINSTWVGDSQGNLPNTKGNWSENGGWRHISIAYTKGKLKVYIDETRLVNIPHSIGNPSGITLEMDGYGADKPEDIQYIKNFRISKGGVKYYDRVLSEGKIIVNGIKFDVNKATLKPESMGPINKIYQLMLKNPDINFSVEGHTDSDGNDANNQTLSEARGKSVMNKLIEMGISENRLKSNGFGESKPIDNNTTAEGKANNRRVEFVKFTGKSSFKNSNTSNSNSDFDKLDRKSIADKLESLPDNNNIPVANNSGIVNGKGTVILFATSDGNMGKMEILDIDKYDNYKMTIKYVTYNYNGSIHGQSSEIEVIGSFLCDLDAGNALDSSRNDSDFWYKVADKNTAAIYPSETSILKIFKN